MNKLLQVRCPQCDTKFSYYKSEFRPFCCERCKMIDLGHWFEESYRLPTKETIQNNQQNEDQGEVNDEGQDEENSEDQFSQQNEDDENDY